MSIMLDFLDQRFLQQDNQSPEEIRRKRLGDVYILVLKFLNVSVQFINILSFK